MNIKHALTALFAIALLSGCIGTASKVVTAPVRVAGKAVDVATTSQSEADEKRGREIRKYEEKLAKREREYERQHRACMRGNEDACDDAGDTYDEIIALRAQRP